MATLRSVGSLRAAAVAFAAAAIVAQILFPLARGAVLDAVTAAVVILLAASALAHSLSTRGVRFTAALAGAAIGGGFAAEAAGVATGFPFGCYTYALDRLGPSIAEVPLVVPLAWAAGSYPVWCAVSAITSRWTGWHRSLIRVPLVTVTITAWDLYLDPQMVTMGYWTWCPADLTLPGVGQIPLTNFAGWLLVSFAIAVALESAERSGRFSHKVDTSERWLQARRDAVPLVLFGWTWLGSALAHAVFLNIRYPEAGLQYSAAFGLLGMAITGVPLAFWLWNSRRSQRSQPTSTRPPAGQHTTSSEELAR